MGVEGDGLSWKVEGGVDAIVTRTTVSFYCEACAYANVKPIDVAGTPQPCDGCGLLARVPGRRLQRPSGRLTAQEETLLQSSASGRYGATTSDLAAVPRPSRRRVTTQALPRVERPARVAAERERTRPLRRQRGEPAAPEAKPGVLARLVRRLRRAS